MGTGGSGQPDAGRADQATVEADALDRVTFITEWATTAGGTQQFRRRWAVPEPRAAALLVHGNGEHSGRHRGLAEYLAARSIDVMAFDNQGFGRSGGRRGHIPRFDLFLDDIEELVSQRRDLGVPVLVYGHSLGGLMVTGYLVSDRPQPDLAVLSAPALSANVARWQRAAAPILGRLVPTLFIRSKEEQGLLSSDSSVDDAYRADPLVVRGATARFGNEVFTAMARTAGRLDRLTTPTYVLHGEADRLVPPSASLPLADLPSVTYRSWPGMAHECHNEPGADQVLGELFDWIDASLDRLGSSST